MIDTQDLARSFNINRLLNVDFNDVQFTGTSGTSLYGLATDGFVRKLDLSAATISRGLLSKVISFSVSEDTDTLSYVGIDPADATKKVAGIYKDGENNSTILRSVDDVNKALAIALGRYFSEDYIAIAEGEKVTILTGRLPSSGASDTKTLTNYAVLNAPGVVSALSFSSKADYMVAQSGAQFTSYEIEHKRSSVGTIETQDSASATTLKWLDEAHLWNDDNGSLTMRDFDGTNAHTIMPVASGFDTSLSSNGTFFYAVGKTDTGYQLQRIRMILN